MFYYCLESITFTRLVILHSNSYGIVVDHFAIAATGRLSPHNVTKSPILSCELRPKSTVIISIDTRPISGTRRPLTSTGDVTDEETTHETKDKGRCFERWKTCSMTILNNNELITSSWQMPHNISNDRLP